MKNLINTVNEGNPKTENKSFRPSLYIDNKETLKNGGNKMSKTVMTKNEVNKIMSLGNDTIEESVVKFVAMKKDKRYLAYLDSLDDKEHEVEEKRLNNLNRKITEPVNVSQIKAKKFNRESIKKLSPKEVSDLDPSISYLSIACKPELKTFLTENNYPKTNRSKKTLLIAKHFNNLLENKKLQDIGLHFRPNKKSYKLLIKLGYKISNIEKNSKGSIIKGLISKI